MARLPRTITIVPRSPIALAQREAGKLGATILGQPQIARLLERHTRGMYVNYTFRTIDRYVIQSYDLLSGTFDRDELETLEDFLATLHSSSADHEPIVIGRISKWAYARELVRSHGQRLVAPASAAREMEDVQMAAVVAGSYLSLGRGDAVGALGHLVTHPLARGGYGHGSALVGEFERILAAKAQRRGERLRLLMLESRADAQTFWRRHGYRNLRGVQYLQPSPQFDPVSGAPLTDPMPEHLMVKRLEATDHSSVDQSLLREAVRAMYRHWYLPDIEDYSLDLRERIKAYLFDDLYGAFCATLPAHNEPVALDEA